MASPTHALITAAQDARARAEAASEAKSRLLANISHEIRNPLNGILGLAELLRATALDAEQNNYVDAIQTSGAALAALIEDILDFSKIEAGKVELAEAPFDLVELVEGVIELLAPRAHSKGLDIASFVTRDVPACVSGDEARLRQILLNLVGNAVKFTTRGGVGLRVFRNGDFIAFSVTDTGCGVAEDSRDAIFEEFEQRKAPSADAEGTGLGLAISRGLADRMGGSLRLEATSPAGSTFTLRLPLQAEGKASDRASLVKHRIFVIASSPFEGLYLAEKLTEAGAAVTAAKDTGGGLALLREAAPDVLIVDCALGHEAIESLAQTARAKGVGRILVLFSAMERRALAQWSLRDFDGWLVKPLRSRSLFAHVIADRRQSGDAAASIDSSSLRGRSILLAEDDDINALTLTRFLEKSGAIVMRVKSGKEALDEARAAIAGARKTFDTIILDRHMPELDGFSVAQHIRAAEAAAGTSRCRLIMVSAEAPASLARDGRADIDAFLLKPIDLNHLNATLTIAMP